MNCINAKNVIEGITEKVGFPFSIRATARGYHKDNDGTISPGDYDGSVNCYAFDEQDLEGWYGYGPAELIVSSVRSAIGDYARTHAHFKTPIGENELPVLYLFKGMGSTRDRKSRTSSEFYKDTPTLVESKIRNTNEKGYYNACEIIKDGLFEISLEKLEELERKAVEIFHRIPFSIRFDGLHELARLHRGSRVEGSSLEEHYETILIFSEKQEYLIRLGIIEKPLFTVPSIEELARISGTEEHDALFLRYCQVDEYLKSFGKIFYDYVFTEEILRQMSERFNARLTLSMLNLGAFCEEECEHFGSCENTIPCEEKGVCGECDEREFCTVFEEDS